MPACPVLPDTRTQLRRTYQTAELEADEAARSGDAREWGRILPGTVRVCCCVLPVLCVRVVVRACMGRPVRLPRLLRFCMRVPLRQP